MAVTTKRQNFDVTPEQEAEISLLQSALGAGTAKDAILRAVRLALVVTREVKGGKRLGFLDPAREGRITEVLLPELETIAAPEWKYLVARPHPWKRQLFVKGHRFAAAQVWRDMRANGMSEDEAAGNWDLPRDAVAEIVAYCERNRDLLRAEAEEERLNLARHGVRIDAAP